MNVFTKSQLSTIKKYNSHINHGNDDLYKEGELEHMSLPSTYGYNRSETNLNHVFVDKLINLERSINEIFGHDNQNNEMIKKLFVQKDGNEIFTEESVQNQAGLMSFYDKLNERGRIGLGCLKEYFMRLDNTVFDSDLIEMHRMIQKKIGDEVELIFEYFQKMQFVILKNLNNEGIKEQVGNKFNNTDSIGGVDANKNKEKSKDDKDKDLSHNPSNTNNDNTQKVVGNSQGQGQNLPSQSEIGLDQKSDQNLNDKVASTQNLDEPSNKKNKPSSTKKDNVIYGMHEFLEYMTILLQKYQHMETEEFIQEEDDNGARNEFKKLEKINECQNDLDKIKVLFSVRKEDRVLKLMENLEYFLQKLFSKNSELAENTRQLLQEKDNLRQIGDKVITGLKKKIDDINIENEQMYKTKVYSKNEQLSQIGNSIDQIEETHKKDTKILKQEIFDQKDKLEKRTKQVKTQIEARNHQEIKLEKGTQFTNIDFIGIGQTDDFDTYYNNINNFITEGKLHTREWACFTITNILNEKLVSDYEDYCENRKFCIQKKYQVQYFLKKFGSRRLAIGTQKDFIYTQKIYHKEYERISLFLDLCGQWEVISSDENIATLKNGEGNKHAYMFLMKKKFFESITCNQVFIRFCQLIYKRDDNRCSLFIPNVDSLTGYFIKKRDALSLVHQILSTEGITERSLIEFENNFDHIVQMDMYRRTVDEDSFNKGNLKGIGDIDFKHNTALDDPKFGKEKEISFDTLARTCMNMFVDEKVKELERVYITLKVQNGSKLDSRISYDDFMNAVYKSTSDKTSRWIDENYPRFLRHSQSTNTPQYNMFENTINDIENKGIKDDFYIPNSELATTEEIAEIERAAEVKLKGKKGIITAESFYADTEEKVQLDKNFLKRNPEFKNQIYDPFSAVIASKLHYSELETMIENEEGKKESVSSIHDDLKKYLMRYPMSAISKLSDEYKNFKINAIQSSSHILFRKARNVYQQAFNV